MQQEVFEVKRERFHLLVPNRYLLQGNIPKESEVEAYLAGERLSVKTEDWENNSALERFQDLDLKRGRKVTVTVTLPERLPQRGSLKIYYSIFGKQTLWFSVSAAELGRRMGKPQYFIEEEKVLPGEKSVQIRGWTADRGPVRLKIYDEQKQRIPADIQWNQRVDVAAMYKEADIETKCGFFVELREVTGSVLYLVFQGEREKAVYPVPLKRVMVLGKEGPEICQKGSELSEKPRDEGSDRQSGSEDSDGEKSAGELSEMDSASSSFRGGATEPERKRVPLVTKDFCGGTVV